MKFIVTRCHNYAINNCYVCDKKMYKIQNRKTIFQISMLNNEGTHTVSSNKYVCSNLCANTAILQYDEYAEPTKETK